MALCCVHDFPNSTHKKAGMCAQWFQLWPSVLTHACVTWPRRGNSSWWRHQMETFSASLAICAGNSPVAREFPTQRPLTRSFDVFFDLRLNKRLNKQSWGWLFETLSRPFWCHCNVIFFHRNFCQYEYDITKIGILRGYAIRSGRQTPDRWPPRPLTSRGTSAWPYRVTTQYSFYPVQIYSWHNNSEALKL